MKRKIDFALALAGLLVLWPVLLVLMACVRLESSGPAIFRQIRVGRHQTLFTLYKIRSMAVGTQNDATHLVGAAALTRVGRFARRTKLDELPQLCNVLMGEMSFVGPRPCLPTQQALIAARAREGVFEVLPGITGLAQTRDIDMSDPERLARVDGEYARSCSLAEDLRILMTTLAGRGLGVDRVAK